MESLCKFSRDSVDNFLKNKKLKESFKNLDFDCIKTILFKMKEYENKDDQANNETFIQEIENPEKHDRDCKTRLNKTYFDYLTEVSFQIRDNLYHLNGSIDLIKTHLHKDKHLQSNEININFHNLRFDIEIILRDSDCQYHIRLSRIKAELMENLNKFSKKSVVFFTNLKADLVLNDKQVSSKLLFSHTIQTKIYVKPQSIQKTETPQVLNNIYENDRFNSVQKCRRPSSQNYFPQSAQDKRNSLNNEFNGAIDITKSNENEYLDFIDSNNLNIVFSQIPLHYHDFTSLLQKTVSEPTCGMKNIFKSNAELTYKDVCGIIRSIILEEKILILELVSIKDSNSIKVLIYDRHSFADIKENMIILFKRVAHKVNKNFDFVLENPKENNIKVIGLLSKEEAAKLRKFRIDQSMKFSSLIDLLGNTIDRAIHKYLVTIKEILKIQGIYIKDHRIVPGCPNLKLIGKCLIDDGTFEGIMYFYDLMVMNLLRIDRCMLDKISKLTQENLDMIVYDKHEKHNILQKDSFEDLFLNQVIVYGVPFSTIAKKNIYQNGYNQYFENLGQYCNMNSKAKNLAFINGDVIFEKQMDEEILVLRPYIHACSCQFLNSD